MGVLEDTLGVRPWGMPLWLFMFSASCRLRGRRFLLLDVGAEPAAHGLTRRLYSATVRLAHHVSYRDEVSVEAMRSCGAREPDAVAPDLAFAHPGCHDATPEPGRVVIGVMAYYGTHDDPVLGVGTQRRYLTEMSTVVSRLAAAGDHVVLVGGDRVDIAVAHRIRAAATAVGAGGPAGHIEVREIDRFGDLSAEMGRAEVVVASRFHNLICALRQERPTVSLGYASKNRRLMHTLGLDEYCQDIETVDAALLLEQLASARAEAAPLSARIRAETSDYARQVHALLDSVAVNHLGHAEPTPRAGREVSGSP
jgi:polysaccharide pyruvyl transferase WcaK-like protein